MKIRHIIIVSIFLPALLLSLSGCGKIIEKFTGKDSKTGSTEQTDLQKKEKELELKERELALEKEKMNLEKERGTTQGSDKANTQQQKEKSGSKVNLRGFATMWFGSIKDGTDWEVSIVSFDGTNFKGRNTIYWKTSPNGFSTNFTGTIDDVTRKVIMYEDRKAKGSGTFTGTISQDGSRMSGSWTRYTDGVSFNWDLAKMEKGDAGH